MNESATAQAASLNVAANIGKAWTELSDPEKIETLRRELVQNRYLTRQVGDLQAEVFRLKNHEHGGNGQVVVPLHTANAQGLASGNLAGRSFDPLI